ncbi:hypothetical protein JTB14_017086 [Gonioctena quinquepunctata]|nr:hypothetical protein JTB14_017086 [Gonioctena quinquepunctata]
MEKNPTRKLAKLDKLGKLFPMFNREMIEAIIDYEHEIWLVASKENEGKIKEFPKDPKFEKHKEKFDIMKSREMDDENENDFEELIEEFYLDESYTILKNYEIARKQIYKNDEGQKQTVENIVYKEFFYRRAKLRRFLAWTVDVISGKQMKPLENPGLYTEENSKFTEKWCQSDPNSFRRYTEKLEKMREHEIRKTQSIEKQKTNPEDIRKDENMDTTSSHENVEGSKPEELYVRLERLDKEDLKKREELWEKEILEDNLREKKKKEEKLNKQKQKDIINKGKAQTPLKKAAAKAPSEKSPLQTAYEEDQKELIAKEAEHKRQLEIYRRTKEFHELQRTKRKESAAEEYFEHLSESAKEERNEQQEPKERRSTLPQEDDNLEDEYFNYLASSDDETTSEECIFSDGGTYMGQTITPRSGEDISLLEDQGKENMEINKQQQETNIEEEIPHIFQNPQQKRERKTRKRRSYPR